MNSPEDSSLRQRFANLREEDRSAAPPFARTASAVAGSSRRAPSVWMAFAAVPILAIAVMLAWRTYQPTHAPQRQLTAWTSPTAFLLETPGKQFLSQTPEFGRPLLHALPAAQNGQK
jgi:hypothetical protein